MMLSQLRACCRNECGRALEGNWIEARVAMEACSTWFGQTASCAAGSVKHARELARCLRHVFHAEPLRTSAKHALVLACVFLLALVVPTEFSELRAQPAGGWSTDLDLDAIAPKSGEAGKPAQANSDKGVGTTVLKKKAIEQAVSADMSKIRLIALLTADGQRIEQDVMWRVFEEGSDAQTVGKLVATQTNASPVMTLKPGNYFVNVSFGRANLTRKITIAAGVEVTEPFVLNAGGLRVRLNPVAGGMESMKASYEILTDERDQSGNRRVVFSRARPGIVIWLNSGIYHIVSTLGDANATVAADVTVEAGKLTETSISHKAGRVTLKLVTRQGGEALPDTEWTVMASEGPMVKSSVGALPTHILAPGKYMAVAKSQGRVFRQSFAIADGQSIQVEVLRQ